MAVLGSSKWNDTIAATVLIVIGSAALIGRLGLFQPSDVAALQTMLPWLLIGLGVFLWITNCCRSGSHRSMKSQNSREVKYGK